MKSIGYAVLLAGLVGGSIFLMNLMSGMAREKCARVCPDDKSMLVTDFDLGFVKYVECKCQ